MKLALFFIILLASRVQANSKDTEWFNTKSLETHGQALVVHGLNTKPEKMQEIIKNLNKRGYDALLLRLEGHNNDLDKMKKVTYKLWHGQILKAFEKVTKKNNVAGGQIALVGYSLGGVLLMDMLTNDKKLHADQAILFAPALSIRSSSYLIEGLFFLGNKFVVPSLSPEDYKAQKGTTIAAYRSLFNAVKHFEKSDPSRINIPTVVFMDKSDELVSYDEVKHLCHTLNNCKFITVDNKKSSLKRPYHHLIIDPESLGRSEWELKILPEFDMMLGKSYNSK